jgi:hypothetical protein
MAGMVVLDNGPARSAPSEDAPPPLWALVWGPPGLDGRPARWPLTVLVIMFLISLLQARRPAEGVPTSCVRAMSLSDDEDDEICPLCCEDLDVTDRNFFPCHCGYQVRDA